MLWFRCLSDGNDFIGTIPGVETMDSIIIKNIKYTINYMHFFTATQYQDSENAGMDQVFHFLCTLGD